MATPKKSKQHLARIDKRYKTKLLQAFEALYPEPRSELDFTSPYQLVVAVALSAQCTDKKVNQVTPALFSRFPDFRSLADAPLEELETILRPINYYKTKSKNLKNLGEKICAEFHCMLPTTRASLISLPGVGNKTASVVLGEMGIEPALPVDTHVFRVAQRLGLAKGTKVEQIEAQLCAEFEPSTWRNLHHWLIYHGRRICKAPRPLCEECTIRKLCPSDQSREDAEEYNA